LFCCIFFLFSCLWFSLSLFFFLSFFFSFIVAYDFRVPLSLWFFLSSPLVLGFVELASLIVTISCYYWSLDRISIDWFIG
jgi:hypothetical protein